MLSVTIHLRDKTTKALTENIDNVSGDGNKLKALSTALQTLQTKVNDYLTGLVENEKGSIVKERTQNKYTLSMENNDDDEEEEDDDKSADNKEPPVKQRKTVDDYD